jgi:tetrapyrrole methylase family protein/MazG family protein
VAQHASGGTLGELPRALPALMLAQRMQELAARAGFAWPDLPAALGKVAEELAELRAAAEEGSAEPAARELGDLLFAVANLPRFLGLDGEQALRDACAIFRERFASLEENARSRGRSLRDCTPEELAQWWRAAR